MGFVHQTLAGRKQGLKTPEVSRVTLPPGSEIPIDQHYGEVVCVTLQGIGRAIVDEDSFNLFPNTTLVIPAQATRQAVNTSEEGLVILAIRSLVSPPEKRLMKIMGKMS